MNNRIKKKKFSRDMISRIETLNPGKYDTIVLYFDMDECDLYTMSELFNKIANNRKYKYNAVMMLPDATKLSSWEFMDKEQLEQWYEQAKEAIGE